MFCQRNQRSELTDSEEGPLEAELSVMFCPHSEKKRKREKSVLGPITRTPPTPPPAAQGRNIVPADESLVCSIFIAAPQSL